MGARISYEGARGCGYRKEGGTYLVCEGPALPCGKLPYPLKRCPTCGAGIKPSRGWTWVDALSLLSGRPCSLEKVPGVKCRLSCPLSDVRLPDLGKAGLLWIGEKYYSTPEAFQAEARKMGISRRIAAVPRDFKLGETWVLLAHRKGDSEICPDCKAERPAVETCETCARIGRVDVGAIFAVFKPTAVERIVSEDVSDEEVEKLEKKGLSPVIVRKLDASGTPELPIGQRESK